MLRVYDMCDQQIAAIGNTKKRLSPHVSVERDTAVGPWRRMGKRRS